jgi:hypothetical protein
MVPEAAGPSQLPRGPPRARVAEDVVMFPEPPDRRRASAPAPGPGQESGADDDAEATPRAKRRHHRHSEFRKSRPPEHLPVLTDV